MKKNEFILIASITIFSLAALILTSCDREENDTPMYPGPERVITLTAALPGGEGHGAKTRLTFEEVGGEIKTKWESDHDVLHLLLINNSEDAKIKEWKTVATIKKVNNDNRIAEFEIKLPNEWTEGNIDVYGLLQRSNSPSIEIPCIEKKRKEVGNIFRMKVEDETAFSTEGSSNPALWFKQEGVKIAKVNNMCVNLQHCGYLVAIHINNKSEFEFKFKEIGLYVSSSRRDLFFEEQFVNIDVETGQYIPNNLTDGSYFSRILNLGAPISIASHTTKVLYHWFPLNEGNNNFPETLMQLDTKNAQAQYWSINIPPHTVDKGKVYHLYLMYDGSKLTRDDINVK